MVEIYEIVFILTLQGRFGNSRVCSQACIYYNQIYEHKYEITDNARLDNTLHALSFTVFFAKIGALCVTTAGD